MLTLQQLADGIHGADQGTHDRLYANAVSRGVNYHAFVENEAYRNAVATLNPGSFMFEGLDPVRVWNLNKDMGVATPTQRDHPSALSDRDLRIMQAGDGFGKGVAVTLFVAALIGLWLLLAWIF